MGSMVADSDVHVSQPDDERNRLWIFGAPIDHAASPDLFNMVLPGIGLPKFKYGRVLCASLDDPEAAWHRETKAPYALGSCLTMPLKIQVIKYLDELTPEAKTIGSVNTTYFRTNADGHVIHVGTNADEAGVRNSLLSALLRSPSPFPPTSPTSFAKGTASALMVGGGGAARAAIYALDHMGLSPVYLINRDAAETAAIVAQFPDVDLRPLNSVAEAEEALEEGTRKGSRLAVGVGAIPSIPPVTDAEKNVYEVAKTVFGYKYDASDAPAASSSSLKLPVKPVYLDMAYHPHMTISRTLAEDRNWETICGIEAVLECCFAQAYIWTGRVVPPDVRDAGRAYLRAL